LGGNGSGKIVFLKEFSFMINKINSSYLVRSLLMLIVLFLLTGCTLPWSKKPTVVQAPATPVETISTTTDVTSQLANQSKIKKFASKEELASFIETHQVSSGYNGFEGEVMNRGLMVNAVTDSIKSAPMAKSESATQSLGSKNDYSKTNVQVEGVDEADIVKTDGRFIYALNKKEVVIIAVDSAIDTKVVSRISFGGQPQELYISGDKLVIFGQSFDYAAQGISKCENNSKCLQPELLDRNLAFVNVYDVADRNNPKLVRDLAFDGTYTNSRLIGDFVYLITSRDGYGYDLEPLPLVLRDRQLVKTDQFPSVYYVDMPYRGVSFTTISAISLKDDTKKEQSEIYLLNGNQNLFVSQNSIYITYTKYLDENQLRMEATKELLLPKISTSDQSRIAKIEAADIQVLSPTEKITKIYAIISRYLNSVNSTEQQKIQEQINQMIKQLYADIGKELEKTVIHKLAINQEKIEYQNVAEVPGSVLNQFAMDEQDGFFRIATTKNQTWSNLIDETERLSSNNLYVLDQSMKQIGALENLARGEKIYSVRFMGKRAYMVTFKQTDPLFVIDLAVPSDPKVLGELKIPGFSNYLHPYDENTLIGFGKETSENQFGGVVATGLKLSLFDVKQVDKPIELDHYVMGDRGSDSIALNNHRAFLFSKDKNLLVVPVSLYQSSDKMQWGRFVFGGVTVFAIDDGKFVLRGKIDHSDNGQPGDNYYLDGFSYYDNNVLRSMYIKDTLYTYSGRYLKANKIADLTELNKVSLTIEQPITQSSSTKAVSLPALTAGAVTPAALPVATSTINRKQIK